MIDLRAAALAAALALAAGCGSGLPGRDPLHVNAMSGGKVDLSNTSWEWCVDDAAGSTRHRESHGEEGAITILDAAYGAPACAGTPTAGGVPFSAYGEAVGDIPVTWAGTPPPGAPNPPPLATKVVLNAGGAYGLDVYLLDDRDPAQRVLYTADLAAPLDDSGFPTQLHPVGERQIQ